MAKLTDETRASLRRRSRLVNLGRDSELSHGFVNIPPFRGSTVLYPDVETLKKGAQRFTYGRRNSPTIEALHRPGATLPARRERFSSPRVSQRSRRADSGARRRRSSADGGHGLWPFARSRQQTLKRMGIETTFYDPRIGAEIASLMRANTRAIFAESPGSETLEVQDVPAIAAAAHARDVCLILDNTWATPLFFPPHAHGVDMVVEAGTKYLSGHSDLLIGLVSANENGFARLHRTVGTMGIPAGPEDIFLALRGLRTMELRLREAEQQALALAHWLDARPEVLRVLHPALPDHPGHAFWKRDFSGSSGLFSVVLKPASDAAVAAMLDDLELFGLGYSWAGFESLVVPVDCASRRTATRFAPGGPMVRFSVGLEDIEDLKADLDRGFARLRATA